MTNKCNTVIDDAYNGSATLLHNCSHLAFTGYDVWMIVLGGILLLVIGAIMRKATA